MTTKVEKTPAVELSSVAGVTAVTVPSLDGQLLEVEFVGGMGQNYGCFMFNSNAKPHAVKAVAHAICVAIARAES